MLNHELERPLDGTRVAPQPQVTKTAKRTATGYTGASEHASGVTDPHAKPWDTPGLAPRLPHERCQVHLGPGAGGQRRTQCAYRDDDPARCPNCHRRYGLPNGCGKSDFCIGGDAA